jgi:hypothetical protein
MNIIDTPQEYHTTVEQWWFVYDKVTNELISPPMQCEGYTSSPFSLGIGSSEEDCFQYIKNLQINTDNFDFIE